MREQIIGQDSQEVSRADATWLDLQRLARVELSSEDEAYPIESALAPGAGPGWRRKLESRRSACCVTSRRESAVFNYYFARNSGRARKNSCCGGRRPMVNLTGRLSASNTTLARLG